MEKESEKRMSEIEGTDSFHLIIVYNLMNKNIHFQIIN